MLFEKQPVSLVRFAGLPKKGEKKKARESTPRQRVRDELFESLRQLRRSIAQQQGVPPYIVFNDASLEEMAASRPITDESFRSIQGVGDLKLKRYGDAFIQEIREFVLRRSRDGDSIPGATKLETLERLKKGMNIEDIAREREMTPDTVVSHILYWLENREPLNTQDLIAEETLHRISSVIDKDKPLDKLSEIFEALGQEVPYYDIKLGLALLQNGPSGRLASIVDAQ